MLIANHKKKTQHGLTLLEIMIALFIFTLVLMLFTHALGNAMDMRTAVAQKSERLHDLQMAIFILERDIEQIVNRPILNTEGKEEPAFVGAPHYFMLTHGGTLSNANRSLLQRVGYHDEAGNLWRNTMPVLDQAPTSKWQQQSLLTQVDAVDFYYLDQDKKFHRHWPLRESPSQPLPRAIKMQLTLSKWGMISKLYVIDAKAKQTTDKVSGNH